MTIIKMEYPGRSDVRIINYVDFEEEAKDIVQIDPYMCGCTECLTGEYRPLGEASFQEIMLMLEGAISNATGLKRSQFDVYVKFGEIYRIEDPNGNYWTRELSWDI